MAKTAKNKAAINKDIDDDIAIVFITFALGLFVIKPRLIRIKSNRKNMKETMNKKSKIIPPLLSKKHYSFSTTIITLFISKISK